MIIEELVLQWTWDFMARVAEVSGASNFGVHKCQLFVAVHGAF